MAIFNEKQIQLLNETIFTFRSAEASDSQYIYDFMKDVFHRSEFIATTGEEYQYTNEEVVRGISSTKNNENSILLVALHKNMVVGVVDMEANAKIRRSHSANFDIFIKDEFQGIGLGKKMLQEVLTWAKENTRLKRIELTVFSTHKHAITLYEKCGFATEGKKLKSVCLGKGEYVDELLMCYLLD